MKEVLELSQDIPGVSDAETLHAEIDGLHEQLTATTKHLALERALAGSIHRARNVAISESPALELVFDTENTEQTDDRPKITMADSLAFAFAQKRQNSNDLDDAITKLATRMRAAHHPDAGGDEEVAKQISDNLDQARQDPGFSVGAALLKAPRHTGDATKILRLERYRLHIALAAANPQFESSEAAQEHAEAEIDGAEWRVRTYAAFKTFNLIVGDSDTWQHFVQSIARQGNMHLIDLVNNHLPKMFSLQERLAKGDPIPKDKLDIPAIDTVYERIWSTIGYRAGDGLPYRPPYQNWLPILLPALELLDPGEKAGETYKRFKSPIRVEAAPAPPPPKPIAPRQSQKYNNVYYKNK